LSFPSSIPSSVMELAARHTSSATLGTPGVLSVTLPKRTPAMVTGDRERTERKMGNWGDFRVWWRCGAFYRPRAVGGLHRERWSGDGGSSAWQLSTELLWLEVDDDERVRGPVASGPSSWAAAARLQPGKFFPLFFLLLLFSFSLVSVLCFLFEFQFFLCRFWI
jgi:hypothetical protein